MSDARRIPPKAALEVIRDTRGERDVVITTMAAARDWMALGVNHPLDLVFVPSAMSHATSIGLGLALAQPDRRVIVCNGDGSMLMNLGSLVSIAEANARNLVVAVLANGTYEVTGAQPVPGFGQREEGSRVDFTAIARGAGFRRVFTFSDLESWRSAASELLGSNDGPTFVLLNVERVADVPGPKSPGPAGARATALAAALRG